MKLAEFKASVAAAEPPENLSGPLCALWHDARGAWDTAHEILQDESDPDGCWVHAYLHRVEGDEDNAGYWYKRAERPHCTDALVDEWDAVAAELLQKAGS